MAECIPWEEQCRLANLGRLKAVRAGPAAPAARGERQLARDRTSVLALPLAPRDKRKRHPGRSGLRGPLPVSPRRLSRRDRGAG